MVIDRPDKVSCPPFLRSSVLLSTFSATYASLVLSRTLSVCSISLSVYFSGGLRPHPSPFSSLSRASAQKTWAAVAGQRGFWRSFLLILPYVEKDEDVSSSSPFSQAGRTKRRWLVIPYGDLYRNKERTEDVDACSATTRVPRMHSDKVSGVHIQKHTGTDIQLSAHTHLQGTYHTRIRVYVQLATYRNVRTSRGQCLEAVLMICPFFFFLSSFS